MRRLDPFVRARGQELLDRARIDALTLASSVVRRASPRQEWTDRFDDLAVSWRPPARHRMMPLLERFAEVCPIPFFIQIGAHDGTQQDPLRELILQHRWAGILVEPVPYVFGRLSRNYSHLPHIILENVAIGTEDGAVPFYHLADADDAGRPGLPIWFDALGSLNREVVMAHRRFIPDIDERLVETEVPSLTFETLLRRHRVEAIDVLLIDTEGYDAEIIRSIDFEHARPKILIYECVHLSGDDQKSALAKLQASGYESLRYGLDTWCLNMAALSSAERRALEPIWRWCVEADARKRPLLATRALRKAARVAVGSGPREPDWLDQAFGLSEAEQHYFEHGYDDSMPLPGGAAETLSVDNPRLLELKRTYARLEIPAVSHHMWSPERVARHVELRYFRGDNLYLWHYPEHPRAMALTLFLYMRYLESRGGGPLLHRLSEDGLFGAWTTEVAGYGKISRDLLDSVSEILFLERQLGLLTRDSVRVLDVGAGYGRLAYRMTAAHPGVVDYCCVDAVPESTFLAEYYLQFRRGAPPARVVPLDRVQTDLHPGDFDLAVNIHSFSECTLAAIDWWAQQLARLEVPYLFVVPNEAEGILSREVGGGYHDAIPVLAAAGYHPIASEPVIEDAAIRELVRVHDNFYLFARNGADAPATQIPPEA